MSEKDNKQDLNNLPPNSERDDFLPPEDFSVDMGTDDSFQDTKDEVSVEQEQDVATSVEASAEVPADFQPFNIGSFEVKQAGVSSIAEDHSPEVTPIMDEQSENSLELVELTHEEILALEKLPFKIEDLPTLSVGGFGSMFSSDDDDDDGEDEYEYSRNIIRDPNDIYSRVLLTLYEAEDLGVDATSKARIGEAMKQDQLPQLIARDLIRQRVVNSVQLARAVARSQKRKEISNFLNVPAEASELRATLDSRVVILLRTARVIPLWFRESSEDRPELHLAHESAAKDLVLESAIRDIIPGVVVVWHFAQRDVCGAFWLAGDNEDVDSSMEAEALLDRVIGNAIDARSSDIHIDPSVKGEAKAIVKYRVDGFVQSKEVITLDQLERLRVRIENIARMPKVDLNHPNKGAFSRNGFDWRVQIQPHAGRQGPVPRIVIRRLQPDVMPMDQLGYPEYFIDQIKAASNAPNGVLFWTGPTGSGKTESIHSAVVSVNPMGRGLSLHTIEDPPEKRVSGYAVQMEISETDPARSGLELLKSSLRADPDVIIFGEVRDSEMAGLVFEAANTGHLVFSTLHTNTSLDAVVRLDELGVYGYHLSYMRGVAAQRLVRRLCTHCRIPMEEPDEYTRYVFQKYNVDMEGARLFRANPEGCPSCQHRGYHGRIAIAEFLVPNKELIEISSRREYGQLEDVARRAGWKPMGYMGVLHVKNGITDCAELSQKVLELSGDL